MGRGKNHGKSCKLDGRCSKNRLFIRKYAGIDTKMKVLTKVGPISLNDIITVTEWVEKKSIGVIHQGIVTGKVSFIYQK